MELSQAHVTRLLQIMMRKINLDMAKVCACTGPHAIIYSPHRSLDPSRTY